MATSPAPDGLLINTPLLSQELWGGGYFVAPVADPSLATTGDSLEGCLGDLRLALEDVLATAEPEMVARFAMPAATRLEEVEVEAPRPDLPARLAVPGPVALACVVVPFATETWAFLPALEHAVRLGAKDDLGGAVKAEAERLIAALEPSGSDWLRLLPPRARSLEWLDLRVRRADMEAVDKVRAARKKLVKDRKSAEAREVLLSVATPLHERPEAKAGPDLVGRERELAELGALLGGKVPASALVVGPELCGKTALVYAWLREERAARRERQVWATSGSRLVAGMSGLGQWQERVRRVVDAASELDAVLYFDDLGDLLAQHAAESMDIAGALKPALQEGRLRLAGEIVPESLDLLEARHAGFLSALARVRVVPLDAKVTQRVLVERVAWYGRREPDAPNLDAAALPRLLELVERYLPYRAFPGKAIRLLDELRAAHLGDRTPEGGPRTLGEADVYRLFTLKTGVPEFLLREDRALLAADLERSFRQQLVGQGEAVRRVVEALCEVKAGLQPLGKPLATFLFVGPTGVGKTELARQLAALLFGSPDRLFRFDMSEFADAWAAARLFQGNDRAEGLLTRRVRQQPFCVLLFDEIEKAHPAVFDLLLQVLGEGRLTDARGRTAYFQNALIVLTSNLGAAHRREALGIGAQAEDDARYYRRAVERAFRPELVNRIDHIIPFAPLSPDEARQVTRLVLDKVAARRGLGGSGVKLEVSGEALEHLARGGYAPAYGARALRRHVEGALVAPVAALVAGATANRPLVRVRAEVFDGGLAVEGEHAAAASGHVPMRAATEMQGRRRAADRLFGMEAVEQLREHVAVLLAQISGGEGGRDKRTAVPPATLARLREEHQRLGELLQKADGLREALEAAEELTLLSFFGKEDSTQFLEDGRAQEAALRRLGPYLLLGLEPRRDSVTLMLQEVDEGRALDVWLAPLLEEARERRWTFEGRPGLVFDQAKKRRRWTEPVPGAKLAKMLGGEREFREVLLHVTGLHAGTLLALEAGLHRFHRVSPRVDPAHLFVLPQALRTTFGAEELDRVLPINPPPAKQLNPSPAVRTRGADGFVAIEVKDRRLQLDPTEYWRRFEEVALEHLLHHEQGVGLDRETVWRMPLDLVRPKASG